MNFFKTIVITTLTILCAGLSIASFDSAQAMIKKNSTEVAQSVLPTQDFSKTLASMGNSAIATWPLQAQVSDYNYQPLQSLDEASLRQIYLISATLLCLGLLFLIEAPSYYAMLVRNIRGQEAFPVLPDADSLIQNN